MHGDDRERPEEERRTREGEREQESRRGRERDVKHEMGKCNIGAREVGRRERGGEGEREREGAVCELFPVSCLWCFCLSALSLSVTHQTCYVLRTTVNLKINKQFALHTQTGVWSSTKVDSSVRREGCTAAAGSVQRTKNLVLHRGTHVLRVVGN